MTLSRIRSLLTELKLPGMNARLDLVLDEVRRHNWTVEDALDALLQSESDFRKQRGIRTRLRASRIKGQAAFEDYDFTAPRSLTKAQFKEISSLSWLHSGHPLVLIGQTGVGKSFLAQSAGAQACHIGKTVLHFSVTEWLDERQEAHRTGQVLKFRKRMVKPDLLVLDDFGLKKFTAEESEDFRELLEERSFGKSLLLTTQLPFDHWSEVIPDPVLSEAIIDRLEGPALAIRITGESYRKYRGKKIMAGEEKTR